jgi:2-phospho-L-lactate guanylyltransferase
MRTLAVLPIKSFDAATQRLAGLLGSGSRQALAQAMFSDVLASLRRVAGIEAIAVVTADARAETAARAERVRVIADAADAGHPAAAMSGIRHALAGGFERALLVPGDTPLLDPAEVSALLERSASDGIGAAIVPDREGAGTNALLLSPPDAIEPAFGPGSRARHVAAAEAAGIRYRVEQVPSLLHDVDTPDDLADLAAALEGRRGLAPNTRGALRQLDRSRVAGRSAGSRAQGETDGAANVRVLPARV